MNTELKEKGRQLGVVLAHSGIPMDNARDAALTYIAENGIVFASLDERGDFFMGIGQGYSQVRCNSTAISL